MFFVVLTEVQVHFSRANALAAYKAKNITDIQRVNMQLPLLIPTLSGFNYC